MRGLLAHFGIFLLASTSFGESAAVSSQLGWTRSGKEAIYSTGLGASFSNGSVGGGVSGQQTWLPSGSTLSQGSAFLSIVHERAFQPSFTAIAGQASDGLIGGGFDAAIFSELNSLWDSSLLTALRVSGGASRYARADEGFATFGNVSVGFFQELGANFALGLDYTKYLRMNERVRGANLDAEDLLAEMGPLLGMGASSNVRANGQIRVEDWVLRGGWSCTSVQEELFYSSDFYVGREPWTGFVAGIRGGWAFTETSVQDLGLELSFRW